MPNAGVPLFKPHPKLLFSIDDCSLGLALVALSSNGLAALLLGDQAQALAQDLNSLFPNANMRPADGKRSQFSGSILSWIDDPSRDLAVPLDVSGTDFQKQVWRALVDIPTGTTCSYSELANRIGAPKSARAVAAACAANKIAIAIPCHRVRRHDGSLSGYRWGVDRKRRLLEREAVGYARPSPHDAAKLYG